MSQVLTESIARAWGASVAEEVIQTVCAGCSRANLDFAGDEFCPIQVNYGVEGEDKHIVYEMSDTGIGVWCTEHTDGD